MDAFFRFLGIADWSRAEIILITICVAMGLGFIDLIRRRRLTSETAVNGLEVRIDDIELELAACRAARIRENRNTKAMIQMISESFGILKSTTGGKHHRKPPPELYELEARAKRLLADVIADNGV